MNKAYDLLLNFESVAALPFYEWKPADNLVHLERIGFVKVSNKIWQDIRNNHGVIDLSLIEKEILLTNVNKKIPIVITSDLGVFGVLVDKSGKVYKRSGLLLDEERELMELNNVVSVSNIKYLKKGEIGYNYELTKEENEMVSIYKDNLLNQNTPEKLQYWYFEITGKEESNLDKILKYLKQIDDLELIKKVVVNPSDKKVHK